MVAFTLSLLKSNKKKRKVQVSKSYSQKPVRNCYPKEKCPDCNTNIPHNAIEGSECKNCGHVFCHEHEDTI